MKRLKNYAVGPTRDLIGINLNGATRIGFGEYLGFMYSSKDFFVTIRKGRTVVKSIRPFVIRYDPYHISHDIKRLEIYDCVLRLVYDLFELD